MVKYLPRYTRPNYILIPWDQIYPVNFGIYKCKCCIFTDLKGKKKRDGIGSPDKASTPSVLCEGFLQDAEGQKRPIINEEILALQIKEDDLMKVKL